MIKKGLSPKELININDEFDAEKAKEDIIKKVNKFKELIKWSDEQLEEYRKLYDEFIKINKKRKNDEETQKQKGDALEKLVNFIFNNSFFLEVHPNKRNSTNEIDQFITVSDYGMQAFHEFNFNRALLGLDENHFICECKNYKGKIPATWIGKFNTLLNTCGETRLGIVFSYHGLTGKENNWYDAHGLTKIVYRISREDWRKFILDFNKDDFEKLLDRKFNIVLCPRLPMYLDYAQDTLQVHGVDWRKFSYNSYQKVYSFSPQDIPVKYPKNCNILGIQANLWTERIETEDRLDYMLFPRMAALAENAWTKEKNKNINSFNIRLKKQFNLYKKDHIYYSDPFTPKETGEPVR